MNKKTFGYDYEENDISNTDALVKSKKVTTERDFQFENIVNQSRTKQGRPDVYEDKRYKATMPKRVSPVVNVKLEALRPLMSELISVSSKVSFNQMIDILIESYINQKLSSSKIEFLRKEISEELEKLK